MEKAFDLDSLVIFTRPSDLNVIKYVVDLKCLQMLPRRRTWS